MENNPRDKKLDELRLGIHWLEFPAAGISFSSSNRAGIPIFAALIWAEGSSNCSSHFQWKGIFHGKKQILGFGHCEAASGSPDSSWSLWGRKEDPLDTSFLEIWDCHKQQNSGDKSQWEPQGCTGSRAQPGLHLQHHQDLPSKLLQNPFKRIIPWFRWNSQDVFSSQTWKPPLHSMARQTGKCCQNQELQLDPALLSPFPELFLG